MDLSFKDTGVHMFNATNATLPSDTPSFTTIWSLPTLSTCFLTLTCLVLASKVADTVGGLFSNEIAATDAKIFAALPKVGTPYKADRLRILDFLVPWSLIARLRSLVDTESLLEEGYQRFGKSGQPFILPSLWSSTGWVVLPRSMLHLLNRSRQQLSTYDTLIDAILLQSLGLSSHAVAHRDIFRKRLNASNVGKVVGQSSEEVAHAISACWGTGNDAGNGDDAVWKTFGAWDVGQKIILRVGLRHVLGTPLCRNNEFVELARKYGETLSSNAVFANALPPGISAVAGWALHTRARFLLAKLDRLLIPHIEDRIRLWRETDDEDKLPQDTLQRYIEKYATKDPDGPDATQILCRSLLLAFVSLFGMSWAFVHTLLHIYGADDSQDIISTIHEECARVSQKYGGTLDAPGAIADMVRLDSAIRESMRMSDPFNHFLSLEVLSGEGLDIGLGGGLRVLPGSRIHPTYPLRSFHMDPDIYTKPHKFDAFRFSRAIEEEKDKADQERMMRCTPTFTVFGYGQHECGGRFLIDQVVKLAIAKIVLEYDVEVVRKPGKRWALLQCYMPPMFAQIRIRRKE